MTAPVDGTAARPSRLPGFEYRHVAVEGITISCAIAGSGPPVLLLHGYPENHLMWRGTGPVLARDHTVVAADLRGYGDSAKPVPDAAGLVYSKRSMAADQAGLMRQLGFESFQLVGHDRGARVAHRLALDFPAAVTRLAVLDIVPTRHVLGNVTRELATAYYHWFFLIAPNGIPEHLIAADPGYWVRFFVSPLLGEGRSIDSDVMEDYIRCFRDPATVAASCADYRSAAGIDLAHDEASFVAGQRVECPVLALWGAQAFVGREYEPVRVWQQYATDVRGQELPTGHFLPEEAPDLVNAALRGFLDRGTPVTEDETAKPGDAGALCQVRVTLPVFAVPRHLHAHLNRPCDAGHAEKALDRVTSQRSYVRGVAGALARRAD